MTSSPVNELHDGSASPIPEREDDVDVDVANDDQGQGQNWLTIRRRCELCKQRKVRSSDILASFVLVHPVFESSSSTIASGAACLCLLKLDQKLCVGDHSEFSRCCVSDNPRTLLCF
jgi:hypothetical protein